MRPISQWVAPLAFLVSAALVCVQPPMRLKAQAAPNPSEDVPRLDFIYEELVTLGDAIHPGQTPWGERNIIPITGGNFAGPGIKGRILPGGWDWQLSSKAGCGQIKADYMIQTDDGVIINVLNKGTFCNTGGANRTRQFTTPVFEAPLGKYDWLNDGAYIGTLQGATVDGKAAVRIRFYKAR